MRGLSAEEAALWAKVTATIRPLSREPLRGQDAGEDDKLTATPASAAVRGRSPLPRPVPPAPPKPVTFQAATLDGGWDRRLASGRVEPDRILDLHGHSLDRAWQAIDRTLERAIASGDRLILLITGHERRGDPPLVRGRIRAAVHDWLAVSRHSRSIAAVRGAHRRHGGGGSLYIVLRKC